MRGSWRLWDTLTFPDRSRWCPKSVSKSWSRIVCPSGLSISRLCMVRRPSPFGNHWKGLLLDEEFGFQAVGHKDPARPSTSPLDEIALFAAGNFNEASPSVWSDSFEIPATEVFCLGMAWSSRFSSEMHHAIKSLSVSLPTRPDAAPGSINRPLLALDGVVR